MDNELTALRQQIDALDDQLLQLLNARAELALKVADIKRQQDPNLNNILDKSRESAIIQRILSHNKGPLDESALSRLFQAFFAESRDLQARTKE